MTPKAALLPREPPANVAGTYWPRTTSIIRSGGWFTMARLVAFGADNGRKALSELDSVDLEAIALSDAWGLSNGHTERVPPSPCTRDDCGGSVLIWDGERRCILCARVPGPS
jgi:hypothetical protein